MDFCPEANPLLHPPIRGQEILKAGSTCRNSTVSSEGHLEIGRQRSDQRPPDCFKYTWSLVPGLVCYYFLEAGYGNCSISMTIAWSPLVNAFLLVGVLVSIETQDMAQNIICSP